MSIELSRFAYKGSRKYKRSFAIKLPRYCSGVTLIELIVFMTVTSVIIISLAGAFRQAVTSVNDPLIKQQLISLAQSQLEEIISRKYDENSPDNGTACDMVTPTSFPSVVIACAGIGLESGESINTPQGLDDIDDFNGYTDTPQTGFTRRVDITYAGTFFGITQQYAKRISVSVTKTSGEAITLSAYRVNQ